jgi:hypothetical protein
MLNVDENLRCDKELHSHLERDHGSSKALVGSDRKPKLAVSIWNQGTSGYSLTVGTAFAL